MGAVITIIVAIMFAVTFVIVIMFSVKNPWVHTSVGCMMTPKPPYFPLSAQCRKYQRVYESPLLRGSKLSLFLNLADGSLLRME
jgi:hypothetical protein